MKKKLFKRLRKICDRFKWRMEVIVDYKHPMSKVENALMFRYDSSPQLKFQMLEDGRFHLIQIYYKIQNVLPCYQLGVSQGCIYTYNELCQLFSMAIKLEQFNKQFHVPGRFTLTGQKNYEPVDESLIVKS